MFLKPEIPEGLIKFLDLPNYISGSSSILLFCMRKKRAFRWKAQAFQIADNAAGTQVRSAVKLPCSSSGVKVIENFPDGVAITPSMPLSDRPVA